MFTFHFSVDEETADEETAVHKCTSKQISIDVKSTDVNLVAPGIPMFLIILERSESMSNIS